jgi:adenylate cyclase
MLAEQDEPFGTVRRETVAVLFADIVGFTRMAETMAPEAVISLLRIFHERMMAQIFACGGTIDKYMGDGILAVFGVPRPGADDAAKALTCADLMLKALDTWNGERAKNDEPPLAIGIGLNYGPAVLGDVGSEHGMAFTVIGDTVNTASRLQQLTRTLETPMVVGEPLVSALRNGASDRAGAVLDQLRDGGELTLRGRAGRIRVWTHGGDGAKSTE